MIVPPSDAVVYFTVNVGFENEKLNCLKKILKIFVC
jgi:hypothetical protein